MTTLVFFKEITQKLTIIENYASEEIKCTIFYYSSSNNVNCHSIQATINLYENSIERSRDGRLFYCYSQFYMATSFPISHLHDAKTLTYLSYQCIY